MDEYTYDEHAEPKEEELLEDGEVTSSEEAFMKGYNDEADVPECAECGTAIERDEASPIEIEGEQYLFCSNVCQEEFKDTLGE